MISATDDKWLQVPNNYGTACEIYILHLSEQIIKVSEGITHPVVSGSALTWFYLLFKLTVPK